MARITGSCRFVYNLALEGRRDWYRPGRTFNFSSQCREVTAPRAEVDWLKAAPVHRLRQVLKDLDRAYVHWWVDRTDAIQATRGRNRPGRRGIRRARMAPNVAAMNHGKKALRMARRSASRERRGSSNRREAVPRVARIQMRVANTRENFLHDKTTTIANNHGTVVVEAWKMRHTSASRKAPRSRGAMSGGRLA
jgi:hypothetical protein